MPESDQQTKKKPFKIYHNGSSMVPLMRIQKMQAQGFVTHIRSRLL